MHRIVSALLGLLFALASLVTLAPPAHACSCASADIERHLEAADQVFVGTADARSEADRHVELVVTVSQVFKGEVAEEASVVTAKDGASCGLEPLPQPGVPWVFFTWGDDPGKGVQTGLCSGSAPVSEIDLDQLGERVGEPTEPSAPIAANGEPDTGSAADEVAPLWVLLGGLCLVAGLAGVAAVRRTR